VAETKRVLGAVRLKDVIKAGMKERFSQLRKMGIRTVMITGDNSLTAAVIAAEAGVDDFIAQATPEAKMARIRAEQAKGSLVAMMGDGTNDAPALAQADVGIAMATGTDVAIETAGITILHGDISKIVQAIKLSKMTMRAIKQNLFWAFIYNVIGVPLATGLFFPFFGWTLSPVFAGMAMAFSSVSVVANSLRIKNKKIS
jgi:Cu2+-exporting ATPase/Cu+-exporting ATPase